MRLGKMLGPDVGGVVFGGDGVSQARPFGHLLADVEVTECTVIGSRTVRAVSNRMQYGSVVAVKRH